MKYETTASHQRLVIEQDDMVEMTRQLSALGINLEGVCPRQLKTMIDYTNNRLLVGTPHLLPLLEKLAEVDRDMHDRLGIDSYQHSNSIPIYE